MQIASNDSVHYYIVTEGSIRLKTLEAATRNPAYLLKATYTDHGINNTGKRLMGEDAMILHTR